MTLQAFVAAGMAATALAPPCAGQTFQVRAEGIPAADVRAVGEDLVWAERRIAAVLGAFRDTVAVRILPDRDGFSDALRTAWGIPETACWMVGAADGRALYLLAPSAWREHACEHDPDDAQARRLLVTHEAVHAFHGQANPSGDVGLLVEIGWFSEGLATFVSGQLDDRHAGRAAEAVSAGAAPARLGEAWSGPYRYGVAGSIVAYVDARWGRDTLRRLLRATTQAELLAVLGITEADLLANWRAWVAAGDIPAAAPGR